MLASYLKRLYWPVILIWVLIHTQATQATQSQPMTVTDITIMNLSNTPTSSVDPFLITDRTGVTHLFWSEDVGGRVVMGGTTAGNTIMYTYWDGVSWSQPNDILLTPRDPLGGFDDPKAWQPEAIIDDYGTIHLIWLGQYPDKLFYSNAPVASAANSQAWSEPIVLANNSTGTQYSIDIEYVPTTNALHVVFARGHWEDQYAGSDPRAITYISSTDRGANWSEPVDIAFTPDPERGYSNVRLLFAPEARLFASWTEWDQTGNGQAVWVARSLDNGRTWNSPIRLAERQGDEYERDWTKLAWLGGDQLVATWEGGFRAYRHFMYSDDAGQTWSEPQDTFYWLIGENGFAEFARDGADNVHFFIAQRIREGTIGRLGDLGLWHSTWQANGEWSDTQLLGGPNGMVNPRVVIASGNQIIAAWYDSAVGEIIALTGHLENVPMLAPQAWLTEEPSPNLPEETILNQEVITPTSPAPSPQQPLSASLVDSSSKDPINLGSSIWFGALPVSILISILLAIRYFQLKHFSRSF